MNAKVQLAIGELTFSGEGSEAWLEKQINKLLAASAEPHDLPAKVASKASHGHPPTAGKSPGTLPTYLSDRDATVNQVRKFLATAQYLHDKGSNRVKTAEVVAALSTANQKRLGNAPECLNKNVAKGHCEKEKGEFFVTDEGRAALAKK